VAVQAVRRIVGVWFFGRVRLLHVKLMWPSTFGFVLTQSLRGRREQHEPLVRRGEALCDICVLCVLCVKITPYESSKNFRCETRDVTAAPRTSAFLAESFELLSVHSADVQLFTELIAGVFFTTWTSSAPSSSPFRRTRAR